MMNPNPIRRSAGILPLWSIAWVALLALPAPGLPAQEPPPQTGGQVAPAVAPQSPKTAQTVLFMGNSFMFGAGSPVRNYAPQSVIDLNGTGVGGVPALFKAFTVQAGLDMAVSLETVSGAGIELHFEKKKELVGRAWDIVVMQGYSTLNRDKPGDPELLVRSVRQMAEMLVGKNPRVDLRLVATWSRADQTYPEKGHWHGQPIEAMAKDVRTGYDLAAAGTPVVKAVIPVGEAWNRAMQTGVADPNPYDGITPGQVDLWAADHYHGSTFGYYLEALMIFGNVTGIDPRSLGGRERAAAELGLSAAQASALQQVAADELGQGRARRR